MMQSRGQNDKSLRLKIMITPRQEIIGNSIIAHDTINEVSYRF